MSLDEFLEALDDDDDLYVRLAQWHKDAAYELVFEMTSAGGDQSRLYRCIFEGVREERISLGFVAFLGIDNASPLANWHIGDQAELFFSQPPTSAHEILGRIYDAFLRVCGHRRNMREILNQEAHDTVELLRGGYGMLARGPERVLEQIQEALSGLLPTTLVPSYSLAPKLGGSRRRQDLRTLLLGDGFIIFNSCTVVSAETS